MRIIMHVDDSIPPGTSKGESYLTQLGARVRTLRSQRGMTRKALSQHAKVSERYLAQLESGRGNGSIELLRRVARAIGIPVAQLVHDGPHHPVELTLLIQQLERLPADRFAETRKMS